MEPRGDGGGAAVGRVQSPGQEQDLVHRLLGQLRGHQECDGVQQPPAEEHGASRLALTTVKTYNMCINVYHM